MVDFRKAGKIIRQSDLWKVKIAITSLIIIAVVIFYIFLFVDSSNNTDDTKKTSGKSLYYAEIVDVASLQ